MHVKNVTKIALFAAILSVLSFVFIPIGTVPITLQTLGVFLASLLLGAKDGALAVLIYILLGAVGLPVFAGGRGGFEVLIGPTGGYLMSFPIAAYILGKGVKFNNKIFDMLIVILCVFIIYAIGVPYLKYVTGMDFKKALKIGMIPFIIPDIIKSAAAYLISVEVNKRINIRL
ncbi:biotin transporter BioY [Caloramator sp. CAR-1]|uniref:biotin transporter BioY n=1 Tax=Caloramator sp. CAR-1 TaxID=3062777 RepID=UPI0026E1A0CD|nr:biotin transporter BioY [Caloramator sp. CAR-1]MDO6354039.1 biotin transporter BioY [Caloramator sp. CAR-1]